MQINDAGLSFGTLTKRNSTTTIVLHHADSYGTVKDIHNQHKNQGWAGIGYHLYVTTDGQVWRGRPIGSIGAHAAPYNSNSIGICAQGRWDQDKDMPNVQRNAIIECIAYCKQLYPGIKSLVGHKELAATACPGRYYPLDEIKNGKVENDLNAQQVQELITTACDSLLETTVKLINESATAQARSLERMIREAVDNCEDGPRDDQDPDTYSLAIKAGITDGSDPQKLATKQMVAVMSYRAAEKKARL